MNALPEKGFLRLPQIIGNKETPPIIPVSRSAWYAGMRAGRFPQSFKLGPRTAAWRVQDVLALIEGVHHA
jgi:prophage regulatory protein